MTAARAIINHDALESRLEGCIARWDRRQQNPNASGIALIRLDEVMIEIRNGRPVVEAIEAGFNDRLLDMLKTTATDFQNGVTR